MSLKQRLLWSAVGITLPFMVIFCQLPDKLSAFIVAAMAVVWANAAGQIYGEIAAEKRLADKAKIVQREDD